MKKQITTFATCPNQNCAQTMLDFMAQTAQTLTRSVAFKAHKVACRVRDYYSDVLEQELSLRQTGLLVQAQAAFLMAVLPCDAPLVYRVATFGWLITVLLKCKREI